MSLRPYEPKQASSLRRAELYLKAARKAAIEANCPQLVKKIRSAIASHGGATRHMEHRKLRTS